MKAYGILLMALLVMSVIPIVFATSVNTGVGITVTTEQFKPLVWMCDNRVFADDNIQNTAAVQKRQNNYAFEGESIHWSVLVMDKNKIEQVTDVVGTLGSTQGVGNDAEVECTRVGSRGEEIPDSCNARIGEERLHEFDSDTMAYYDCTLTVETADSMHGEYFLTVEAKDSTGLSSTMDENEYWFLNPTIALSIGGGDLAFNDVRPGTTAYSQTLLLGNDAEAGSGVVLDMFMSGTDFYDPAADGAVCSDNTNKLALTAFGYYGTNGAYSTATVTGHDSEGYLPIAYGDRIDQSKEVIGAKTFPTAMTTPVTAGNTLTPGAEMALTFKLKMPEPCVGDFSEGSIYFYGEAI